MVLSDGISKQIIEHAQVKETGTCVAPVRDFAACLTASPQPVVPEHVVADDRDVVERLPIVGIHAGFNQQIDEFHRLRVARLCALAQADGTCNHFERAAPAVIELNVGIGTCIEQKASDA